MVHNPIYEGDGPVYESVHNQQSLDQLAIQTGTHCSASWDGFLTNTVRYIDQPACFHSNTSNNTDNTSFTDNSQEHPAHVSVPHTRKMALKKNGQERNKLHLTISLHGNDNYQSSTKEGPSLNFHADHSSIADETYTEMSPAGGLCLAMTSRSGGNTDLGLDAAEPFNGDKIL